MAMLSRPCKENGKTRKDWRRSDWYLAPHPHPGGRENRMSGYSVQRFRGGFAIVIHEDGKRSRRKLIATDRQSAEAEARTLWANRDNGLWTVGRAVEAYLTKRTAEEMLSIKRRRDAWKAAKPFWENVDPELVDEKMARDYFKWRGVAPATVKLELSMIKTALRMIPKGEISSSPDIWMPPLPDPVVRHLEVAEFHRFLAGVKAHHARLYALLGVFTLARPTALLELKWTQVDMSRRIIKLNSAVRVQSRKRRPVVPIADLLYDALVIAFQMRTTEFVIDHGGKPIKCIKKAFQAASERSKIKATPYTLRHTGAVWAAEQGVPMSELAQMMGHDDDRTTQKHYARYSPTYLRKVSGAIERAYNEKVQDEPTTPVKEE
jgi:integrase